VRRVLWLLLLPCALINLVVGMSAGPILFGSQIRRSEKARKAVG
jgi:hypothetical protein